MGRVIRQKTVSHAFNAIHYARHAPHSVEISVLFATLHKQINSFTLRMELVFKLVQVLLILQEIKIVLIAKVHVRLALL